MRFRLKLIGQNSYMLGARVLTLGVTFLITAMSSRILGSVAGFGQLMLIAAYYVFLREVSVFSFKTYIVREIIDKQKTSFQTLIHIFFFSSFIILAGTGLTTAILKVMGYSTRIVALSALFNASLIFETIIHNNESYFESRKRFDYLFYSHFLYGALRTIVFLLFNLKNPSLTRIIASFIVASFIASIAHGFILRRMVDRRDCGPNPALFKKTVAVSSIFFLSSIFYGLLNSLDIMILSKISGDTAVGIYSPAVRLNKFCFIYAFSFISVIYPYFVSFLNNQPKDYPLLAQKTFSMIVFSSIPIQFLFPYFAKYVILFFFGARYMGAIPILKIIIFCQMPFAIYFFCSRFLLSLHKEKLTVIIDILALIFNFSTLLFLTRYYQAFGAAAAVVLTNIFLVIIYLFFLSRQKITFSFKKILYKNSVHLFCAGAYFLLTFHEHFQPAKDFFHVTVLLGISIIAFFLMSELAFLRKNKLK